MTNLMPHIFKLPSRVIKSIKKNGFTKTLIIIRNNIAGKLNLWYGINQRIAYDCEYQNDDDFSGYATDIKVIAFYLPQFHSIPENDEWWGEGFTEWTNTSKAYPVFPGHYQPREPHASIGYYDLSDAGTLKKQASLAKRHHISGFCFYYYWFSGKKLLEKPMSILLENQDIDIGFCICWANENWTRVWDGKNKDVLIAQKYARDDPQNFITDIKDILKDKRYIKFENKPVIIVYNPGSIPNAGAFFNTWRETAKKEDIGDICIWACRTMGHTAASLGLLNFVDAEVEFPPHNLRMEMGHITGTRKKKDGNMLILDYAKLDDMTMPPEPAEASKNTPLFRTFMMGWDNTSRRRAGGTVFTNFSLRELYSQIQGCISYTREQFNENNRFVFVNAWNEWGEGTYLEPDKKYGFANINTLTKAICGIPYSGKIVIINKTNKIKHTGNIQKRIAVQIHIYYIETIDEIIDNVNCIPYDFDCYISTDDINKREIIEEKFRSCCRAGNIRVEIFSNRGRDVAPFIFQMKKAIGNYDYICHIHSKKTKDSDYVHGDSFRKYLFKHLLGSGDYLVSLFSCFENNPRTGIFFPPCYPEAAKHAVWCGNKEMCMRLLNQMGLSIEIGDDIVFPAGNMFWAKTEAIKDIFSIDLRLRSFPKERGQENRTLAHAIERMWAYLARANNFEYCHIINDTGDVPEKGM